MTDSYWIIPLIVTMGTVNNNGDGGNLSTTELAIVGGLSLLFMVVVLWFVSKI